MTINKKLPWIAGALCTSLAVPAFGAITWNFDIAGNPCLSGSPNNYGNTCTVTGSDGVTTAKASAWANTGNSSGGGTNNAQETAYLAAYAGNGLGVRNRDQVSGDTDEDNGAPNHAMDSFNRVDFILFEFSQLVTMEGVTIGWPPGTSPDSDITVLAFNKNNGAPSLGGQTYAEMTAAGWQFVADATNVSSEPGDTASLTTALESKYWIVSAYNPVFGGSDYTFANDSVKIKGIAARIPDRKVPEPGTLFLLGAAVAMGAWAKRRTSAR